MARQFFILFVISTMFVGRLYAADPGVTDTEIRLGMVNAQSGAASGLGQGMRAGALAVFDEVNAQGGIYGRQIKLLVDDDAYDPNKAIDATLRMIDEQKVFALFGYVGTPTANAVLPIVKDTKTPLIGLFTGAMTLRKPVIPEVINIRASYDDELEVLVERFITDKGARRFAVFYQDDSFGLAVLAGTERALKRRGMEVIAKAAFQRGTTAVMGGLGALIESSPDVVIMVGTYAPVAAFLLQQKQGEAAFVSREMQERRDSRVSGNQTGERASHARDLAQRRRVKPSPTISSSNATVPAEIATRS
jgi:branched-chain amino acid transport system substrate-binding protein